MPVKRKLMDNLKKRYGSKEGERIYYAMENEKKGPFKAKKKKKTVKRR